MTEQYLLYKSHGICVQCGQRDARRGQTRCADCADKQAEVNAKYYKVHREVLRLKMNKQGKARYAERKAAGICVRCGKRLARERRTTCGICAYKETRYQMERQRKQRDILPRCLFGDGEHCETCGKPTEKGKKLCSNCYEKACKNLAKAQEANPKTGGFYKPFYFGKKDRW